MIITFFIKYLLIVNLVSSIKQKHSLNFCNRSIEILLKEYGYGRYRVKKMLLISELKTNRRKEFSHEYKNWKNEWKMVLFIDEIFIE